MTKRYARLKYILVSLAISFIIQESLGSIRAAVSSDEKILLKSPCAAPESANMSEPAPFWCLASASISIHHKECMTSVTEIFVIPWSPGYVNRFIPRQMDQKFINLKTFVGKPALNKIGTLIDMPTSSVLTIPSKTKPDINTKLTIYIPKTTTPVAFKIEYSVLPGIVQYKRCVLENGKEYEGVTVFPELEALPPLTDGNENKLQSGKRQTKEDYYMITRWAMGGFSVPAIHDLSIEFKLEKSEITEIIDSAMFLNDSAFNVETVIDDSETSITTIKGNATLFKPAHIITFSRFVTKGHMFGPPCAMVRDCFTEKVLAREAEPPETPFGTIILGGVIALVLLLIALGVFLWIRKVRKGDDESGDSSGGETALPQSLHHFAYDTGDEVTSNRWRDFTPRDINGFSD